MANERFTSDLKYNVVKLWRPSDVVKYSFIVQNSISHLDLEVSRLPGYFPECSPYVLINTEEKCQKLHSRSRSLLYNLHLDLPKAREFSLKNESFPNHLEISADSPCLASIKIVYGFYIEKMRVLIQYAYTKLSSIDTCRIEKVLKWFMKLDELKDVDLLYMRPNVLRHIVDCMHAEYTDSEFVEKCLNKFHFPVMLRDNDKPERVENLLYLVHRQGGRLDRDVWRCCFSDRCFLEPSFEYVREILKFLNAPHLCGRFIQRFQAGITAISHFWPFDNAWADFQAENKRRWCLLLHLYWIYLNQSTNPSAASESLRLVWNAVSDPFISYVEIASKFEGFSYEQIVDIWDFYSNAVGEHHDCYQPRPLKHLCRSTVRYRLWNSMQWLPEGIEQLEIPTTLKSYLKLEK